MERIQFKPREELVDVAVRAPEIRPADANSRERLGGSELIVRSTIFELRSALRN